MPKRWLLLLLLAAGPIFGQLETNTVTTTAMRSINLQPDEAVFYLTVNSPPTVGLDQVAAAVSSLGVTSANLTGIGNYDPTTLQWGFTLAAPLSSLAGTIGSLTKLQQTITQNNSGLTLTFSVGGTQVSPKLQQSQSCSTSDLIADATAQAQKLAAAAGLVLGLILKLSNVSVPQSAGLVPNAVATGVFRIGALPNFSPVVSVPMTCSLVVQFQLH